jgi:diacylglycerol kinase (ATP)
MLPTRYHIVFNPYAAGGAARKRFLEVIRESERRFGPPASCCVVLKPGDASRCAAEAVRGEADLILVAGGDGTLQQVVNGLLSASAGVVPGPKLGIVSMGTGRGFAQSLGIRGNVCEQLNIAATGRVIPVDTVAMTRTDGSVPEHVFINEAQFGVGERVVRLVGARMKRLGGKAAFGVGSAFAALGERPQLYRLHFDGGKEEDHQLIGLAVLNGSHTGGGMQLVPGASNRDGRLDVLLMHRMPVLHRLRSLTRIYNGTHLESGSFSVRHCAALSVDAATLTGMAADGELFGPGPRHLRVLPSAIHVITPGGTSS